MHFDFESKNDKINIEAIMLEYDIVCKEKNKINYIAGIDEAGRGPLAGPVVCAAVIMPLDDPIDGVDDSKKLTPKKRELLYQQIVDKALSYCIVEIDEKTIDEINILQATKLGMKRALDGLQIRPQRVLIDAVKIDTDLPQENIIHGDAISYSIAAASILAKVHRDRLMEKLDKKYPEYNFARHKGYGTKEHIQNLKKFGKCEIHRDSFIKKII